MTSPALHPIFADILAAHGFIKPDLHRGWRISFDYPPIPWRDFDWTATSPDFDASYEGPEDGWVQSATIFHGPTREAVIAQVDAWLAEEVEL